MRKDNKKEILKSFLDEKGAKLVKYEYYKDAFGDFNLTIEYNGQMHTFFTDKGAIGHNDKLICGNSYHVTGKSDTLPKLLEIIQATLFDKNF